MRSWKSVSALLSKTSVIVFLLWAVTCEAREIRDVTGMVTTLPEKPMRIITLAPSLGELAGDVAGNELERIIGVSEYTDYPPALAKKTSVGPYNRFNLETVVALKPDLVLATTDGNAKDQVQHLRELKVPVVVTSTDNFSQVGNSMRLVSLAMGQPQIGETMASQLAQGLERVRNKSAHRKAKPVVMLQLGDQPLVVAGQGTFLHEALQTVGAVNAFGESTSHYPRPSVEDVLRQDPDIILVIALGKETSAFHAMAERWTTFKRLKAVKNHPIRVLRADALLRPSMRLLEGVSLLQLAIERGLP